LKTVSVVGCGRMGSFLAERFNSDYELIVVDKNLNAATRLSNKLKCLGSNSYDVLDDADIIVLALPTEVMVEAVKQIIQKLTKSPVVVNIATTASDTEIEKTLKKNINLISAKIIGHAAEMRKGERPIIIIDESKDLKTKLEVARLFSKVGTVVFGNVQQVALINTVSSEEGIKTALRIKERLLKQNVPEQLIDFAIRNVAAGTMKAFTEGNIGPFAQKIIEEFNKNKE